ncbi:amyotrophic lateral sclerosis 2 chromosomal region candidate gene 12 protein isoform X2 [Rhinatrema bivittatum]|uniref:amyotrophic lateral sclerosis 2 chromosomal region candidate gene 12 protein isoform X2 n=1 Tax=Rhinatrema bivittatum TaxID=194408 RepID=UPI00112B449D|nr:amyotrophic lateral sclerosis 2 chromosomal region candidate gene 12 protein isoform X2 [Rhinatrema bivittatum]
MSKSTVKPSTSSETGSGEHGHLSTDKSLPEKLKPRAPSVKCLPFKNQTKTLSASKSASALVMGLGGLRHSGYKAARKECVDNKREKTILISPGYHMTRGKDHISVTLGEEFFGSISQTKPDKSPPRKFAQCEIDEIIEDFQEQIAHLVALLEQEKRDHLKTREMMTQEFSNTIAEVQQKNEETFRTLKETHVKELRALQEHYKVTLQKQKKEAQSKFDDLWNEKEFLKSAFLIYKDNLSDETDEKELIWQASWKKVQKEETDKALLQQRQSLQMKYDKEHQESWDKFQSEMSFIQEQHAKDKEELWNEYMNTLDETKRKAKLMKSLQTQLDEKNETLISMNKALRQSQQELERMKSQMQLAEEELHLKIKGTQQKSDYAAQFLMNQNADLRRKLTLKSEELLQEKLKERNVLK